MSKGYALNIGVNYLDEEHYGGTGQLDSCENDARFMQGVLKKNGFKTRLLLTEKATRKNVYSYLTEHKKIVKAGDILVITASCHGSFVDDENDDEDDGRDETWCLHDAQLIDDELHYLLSKFNRDARILIVTDSCHNKTIFKNFFEKDKTKALSQAKSIEVYKRNKVFYDNIQRLIKTNGISVSKAPILTLAACEDDDTALAGFPLSEFTENIKNVLNHGTHAKNYNTLIKEIVNRTKNRTPQLTYLGKADKNFEKETPFTI